MITWFMENIIIDWYLTILVICQAKKLLFEVVLTFLWIKKAEKRRKDLHI